MLHHATERLITRGWRLSHDSPMIVPCIPMIVGCSIIQIYSNDLPAIFQRFFPIYSRDILMFPCILLLAVPVSVGYCHSHYIPTIFPFYSYHIPTTFPLYCQFYSHYIPTTFIYIPTILPILFPFYSH